MHAINYALKGIEPELEDWRDIKMWNAIKSRIDQERELYEKKCSNLKQKQKKTPDTENNASETENDLSDTDNELSDTEKGLSDTEKAKSDGEYEFEFESEFEHESERETESDAQNAPRRETPSAIEYSNKIFKIFQEAGLPCARNNKISFLQRDFKNAMAYIHNSETLRKVPPDDIIAACENYAKTVNDPQSFITGKYSFDRFVTFKNFTDYLPDNFVAENFKDEKKTAQGETKPRREWLQICPACKKKSLDYDNKLQKYVCKDCGRKFEYEEINT
jgi:hypothetical protein